MKRLSTLIVLAIVLLANRSKAQDYSLPDRAFSLGIIAGNYGYDTGVGIEVGTPCVHNTRFSFRVKGTVSWLEQYKVTYDRWATYKSLNVSMAYDVFAVDRCRAYVEVGTYFIFPDAKFSQRKSIQGATGSIGIELFIISKPNFHMCYYFSDGIGYIRAYADKLESKPRYANGFVFNNGFRFYF